MTFNVPPNTDTAFGIGVDVEDIHRWMSVDLRLFTDNEIRYCQQLARPEEGFAGRWVAKEAVVKALSTRVRATVRDVEIERDELGAPHVKLSDRISSWVFDVTVSISHSESIAVAFAVVRFSV